jgi:hypothetical protein
VLGYGQQTAATLKFQPQSYETQTLTFEGKTFNVRAYENIVYVKKPVDTAHQKLNIYIPEAYFEGKSINGYTAATAPVFFPNKVGGYMPATPATTKDKPMGPFPPMGDKRPDGVSPKPLTIVVALSKGYVVASAGARGRTSKDSNAAFTGKAPADIVDLKAAVRYLKFNDKDMPGDANKIISNGTSAGGAMSTLLGATGNNPDYAPYLQALGAADATDDVFAVSAYCPIINLDHSDMAYEWQFNGINTYRRGGPGARNNAQEPAPVLTSEQIQVSNQLKDLFPAYVNSLQLKDAAGNLLSLDDAGNGNFKELVKSYVITSAQKALSAGADLSAYSFLTIAHGTVTQFDFPAYVKYMGRQKTPPAFDALDLSTPENMLFGNETTDKQHFTAFAASHSQVDAKSVEDRPVKMMNPMNYIGDPNANTARHWRIRHGSNDKDTGLAISVLLAWKLQNNGIKADLELPWDKPHSGDYDLEELFGWIDGICK